jgi:WhiB family redox-sensing transcriptional regulator
VSAEFFEVESLTIEIETYSVPLLPDWSGALCASIDPELFFPEKSAGGANARMARNICKQCPVRLKCLSYALDNTIEFGIWGGLSRNERRELIRTQQWLEQTQ